MRVIRTCYSLSRFKLSLFLTLAMCLFTSGCWGSRTIWSAESKSPDGKVLAKARTVATDGGLSINGIDVTEVYLRWAAGSWTDTLVLRLADASDKPVDTQLEMKWLTPTHLELTFKGNQTAVFQATRWFDTEISFHDLSKTTDEGNPTERLVPTPPASAYQKTAPPSRQ